jgi:hypothetical protein
MSENFKILMYILDGHFEEGLDICWTQVLVQLSRSELKTNVNIFEVGGEKK